MYSGRSFSHKKNIMIAQGQVYKFPFSFSQNDVQKFADVTGDKNPIHLNSDYASHTLFKRPIMHGFLGSSIFSKVFGTLFPGEGTVYLKQSLAFVKPMFVNTPYEAVFTVKEVIKEKNRAVIETSIVEAESGETTIKGDATVMNVREIG
jgi:acyl dehydratase